MEKKFKIGDIVWNSEHKDFHRIKNIHGSLFESDKEFNPKAMIGFYYTTSTSPTIKNY